MKYMKTFILTILLFLTACASGRESCYLYDTDSYKGEPGWISSINALVITEIDNAPTFYLRKKYHEKSSPFSRLYDYYLHPGEHKITVQGLSGYDITIYGNFTFKVMIETGHKYMVNLENTKLRNAVVYIMDLTTGEKVGTLL